MTQTKSQKLATLYQDLANAIIAESESQFDIARLLVQVWLPEANGTLSRDTWEQVHMPKLEALGAPFGYEKARQYRKVGEAFPTDASLVPGASVFSYYRTVAASTDPKAARNVLIGYVQNAADHGNTLNTKDLVAFVKEHNRKVGSTKSNRSGKVSNRDVLAAIEALEPLTVNPHFANAPDDVLQRFISLAASKAAMADKHYNSKARVAKRTGASNASTTGKAAKAAKTGKSTKTGKAPASMRGK